MSTVSNASPVTAALTSAGRPSPMHPGQLDHVRYHIDALVEAAEAERLAAHQRRLHRDEHAAHPGFDHQHVPNGVRRAVGHALIELGAAIAGNRVDAEARRAA